MEMGSQKAFSISMKNLCQSVLNNGQIVPGTILSDRGNFVSTDLIDGSRVAVTILGNGRLAIEASKAVKGTLLNCRGVRFAILGDNCTIERAIELVDGTTVRNASALSNAGLFGIGIHLTDGGRVAATLLIDHGDIVGAVLRDGSTVAESILDNRSMFIQACLVDCS